MSTEVGTQTHPPQVLIVVMGVSGTGKSTLGNALAQALHMPYIEGDDLHPKSNVEKMSSGQPLTDQDREPWLEIVRTTAEQKVVENQVAVAENKNSHGVIVTCSALKRYYRDILRGQRKPATKEPAPQDQRLPSHLEPAHPSVLPTYFVFIKGARGVIMERMEKRPGHFMKASMLDSQLQTLESPEGEDGVVSVDLEDSTNRQVEVAKESIEKYVGKGFFGC